MEADLSNDFERIATGDLNAACRQMADDLNRAMYADGVAAYRLLPPLTWRNHLRRRVTRVRAYVVTLWRALKGDDPYDVDYDY